MTKKYEAYGDNNPRIQMIINFAANTTERTMRIIAKEHDHEAAFAMLAVALGVVAGDFQAVHNNHAEDCEECRAKLCDYYELIVKNFGAGFGQAKAEAEKHYASLAEKADDELERVLKEHTNK